MTTLRLEHPITDFDLWKAAFDRDPIDRAGSGVRAHRIYRPVDDPAYVVVDLDLDTAADAEAVRDSLARLWQSGEAAPALSGRPRVRIIETVEIETYPAVDELRAHLHAMWGAVAGGWAQHADFVDARGAVVTERMLELAALRAGDRVLELASGPGSVGLAAAEPIGLAGEVVVSDISPEMTAIAAARARALGRSNVTTRVLDLERIDEPDASYDAVLCREGIMLVQRPAQAAREIRRVLRPGRRAVLTVWGPRQRNPWLGLMFDAVAAQLGAPMPPPGVPGPFSLDDAARLADVLTAAGLADVEVGELTTPYHARSVDDWWTRTAALAGPLSKMLDGLAQPAVRELRARAREAVRPYLTPSGLELPGVCLIATATRV